MQGELFIFNRQKTKIFHLEKNRVLCSLSSTWALRWRVFETPDVLDSILYKSVPLLSYNNKSRLFITTTLPIFYSIPSHIFAKPSLSQKAWLLVKGGLITPMIP